MIDALAMLDRLIASARAQLDELEQMRAALSGGRERRPPEANGATDLSIDDVRAMCAAEGLPCNLMGEMDSRAFCALFGIAEWQLKRWLADGVIEPRKLAGGRKNYFTVEEINKVRRMKEQDGA
jgi:hypothetical protein